MDTLKYIIITHIFAIIAWPVASRLFQSFPDRGWVFSKIIGLTLSAWVVWFVVSLRLISFSGYAFIMFPLILFILTWGIGSSWSRSRVKIMARDMVGLFFGKNKNSFSIFSEVLFLLAVFCWIEVRSHHPSINGLEKFMDYGFLLSSYKSEYFPPLDHFFAGETVNIYYFTHYLAAFISRITFVEPQISFNLQTTLVLAFAVSGAFSISSAIAGGLGLADGRAKIAGVLGAIMMPLAGNLHYMFYRLVRFINLTFDTKFDLFLKSEMPYHYPAATRYIPFTIHEFPLYSFVVNDLHAHLSNIPLALLLVALFYSAFISIYKGLDFSKSFIHFVSLSFFIGLCYPSNAWDYAIYLLLFGFSTWTVFALIKSGELPFSYFDPGVLIKTGIISALALVFSILPFLPFWISLSPPAKGIGMVPAGGGSAMYQLIIIWFLHLYFLICYFYYSGVHDGKNESGKVSSDIELTHNFIRLVLLFSLLLIIIPEIIYIKDIYPGHIRANTMFKLGFQAWILMSICLAPVIVYIWNLLSKVRKKTRFLYISITVALFLFSLYYSGIAIYNGSFLARPRESLDGMNFIKNIDADDHSVISWMNKNISGQPIIVEGVGDSYSYYGRVSTFTGFPTVVGWPVHEWLWRGSIDQSVKPVSRLEKLTGIPDTVNRRVDDVKKFYETASVNEAKEFIKKYGVRYVYIGNHERNKYPGLNDQKLSEIANIVFSSGKSKLFKVKKN
ncbi:MAG TPA: DUF2298 domain-containing protein [Oligoflexia bacterium]|nr:DUF2298 domain-containing protein [Oligoflexia bacterium]HMP48373.1 DUF2298 domain-containing protein [Oligoflexia bacterium]